MSDKQTSTLQSVIDSVGATAQNVLGSITGNQADKQQAQDRQAEANAKDQASHAGTNIAGMSVSASGVAANDPNRQDGSWNQTIGSAKEAVGGLVGAEGLKKEGQDQHAQGQAQEAQGQVNDFGKGVKDRVSGTVGGMVAGATGDREAQAKAEQQHDQGKTLQRGAEADIQKQNS